MTTLSEQFSGFRDSQGKVFDTKDKADMSSAQDLLNRANPGGTLSVQGVINLYVQNPDLWEMVNKLYEERRDFLKKQQEEQLGIQVTDTPKPPAKK